MIIHGLTAEQLIKELQKLKPSETVLFNVKGAKDCFLASRVEGRSVEGSFGVIGCEVFNYPVVMLEKSINQFEFNEFDNQPKPLENLEKW